MEDIFITKLYASGVLRYAENDNDIDMSSKLKVTSKGPNALGIHDSRRVSIRQRVYQPSMLGHIDLGDISQSDPGRSGSLTAYGKMKGMYFDDSLYENKLHFRLAKLAQEIDQLENNDYESLIINTDNEDEYNTMLDALFKYGSDKVRIFGNDSQPLQIIVEKDPREKYLKFDEEKFLSKGE